MSEGTSFGKAIGKARSAPASVQVGAAVALATALQQGIPYLLEYSEAKDARVDEAQSSYNETLHALLDDEKTQRQECERRLREVLAGIADVPVSAGPPEDLPFP